MRIVNTREGIYCTFGIYSATDTRSEYEGLTLDLKKKPKDKMVRIYEVELRIGGTFYTTGL